MSTKKILAIDLGAESGRVIVGVLENERLRLEEVHRFLHESVWLPTGLHWNITGIWREIVVGLRKAADWGNANRVELVSVGVDTWGVDWALVDKAGKVQVYIAEVFSNALNGVHDRDLDLGQFYAKAILAANKWKFKQINRSLLDWIQIMYDVNTNNGFELRAIKKYLGLRPSRNNADTDAPQHEYKIGLKLKGGAVIIGGYYEQDDLVFAGKLGTGLDTKLLLDLRRRMDASEIPAPPFTRATGLPRLRVHWVRPEIVVQAAFIEWTAHGKLRHPRLLGVRFDKNPREVVREAS
jgi:hypothetical protein